MSNQVSFNVVRQNSPPGSQRGEADQQPGRARPALVVLWHKRSNLEYNPWFNITLAILNNSTVIEMCDDKFLISCNFWVC